MTSVIDVRDHSMPGDGTDVTSAFNTLINRIRDADVGGQPGTAAIVDFGPGDYVISGPITIGKSTGIKLRGPGLDTSDNTSHDPQRNSARIIYDGDAGDPDNDTMLTLDGAQGCTIEGLAFLGIKPGQTSTTRVKQGIELAPVTGGGNNGSRVTLRNVAVSQCQTGVIHTGGVGSDSLLFTMSTVRSCDTGYSVTNDQSLHNHLSDILFGFCEQAIHQDLGGQLTCDNITLAFVNRFIKVINGGQNKAGVWVRGLKIDDSEQRRRAILYEEALKTEISGEQGRTRGPVLFEGVIQSQGQDVSGDVNAFEQGTNDTAIVKVTCDHSSTSSHNWLVDKDYLTISGATESTYNGKHLIKFVHSNGGSGVPFVVEIDVPYVADENPTSATWVDGSPLFQLRGGTQLEVRNSFFELGSVSGGRFCLMEPGNFANGRQNALLASACTGLGDGSDVENDLLELIDGSGDTAGWTNWYSFRDIFTVGGGTGNMEPWSRSNYSMDQQVLDLLEADRTVDFAANPWQLVHKRKGTSVELLRQTLREVDGTAVTSDDQKIGRVEV